MLVVKYERKSFFGDCIYTEDKKDMESLKDIKKAFLFLKNNYNAAIQIDNVVLFWDTMQGFEYKTLECREYDNVGGYKSCSWDYDGCKNYYYNIYKEKEK